MVKSCQLSQRCRSGLQKERGEKALVGSVQQEGRAGTAQAEPAVKKASWTS